MAMVDLDGVYKVTAKGRVYYYAWRGKGAPRLSSAPGSTAFIQELSDALASRRLGDKTKLSGMCARYRSSDDWKGVSKKTRDNWSPWLDRIQDKFGDLNLTQFDRPTMRPRIKAWRDTFKATPRAADMALQVFSRLLTFGVDEARLSINVVTDIPRLYRNDRSSIIWTDDDLLELEKHASAELMLAARLAIYTGLRQGDLLRLGWTHLRPNYIEVRTRKTGSTALIPMHAKLRELLAGVPRKASTILTNSDGLPWRGGFGSSWGKATTKAGIDKHFHDLRGTAATELYKCDLTPREIAGIMGWSEVQVEAMLDRYVRRDEIIRDRIRRMDEAESRTKAAKPGAKPSREK